jgi:Raf kinase inhibitor-like YbhB/YbcL family protein
MRILTISLAAFLIMATTAFKANKKLIVTSPAFTNNGMIPAKYSCMGQEASPPLTIENIPDGTKSLAIIVHDPDAPMAGGFTHWVIWNIDPTSNNIPENFKNSDEGLNGMKQTGYKGMCPPKGTHHYHFMVYALDVKLNIDKKTTGKKELEKVMKGHILGQGELVGTFDKSYR